jgi:hypothetical protein
LRKFLALFATLACVCLSFCQAKIGMVQHCLYDDVDRAVRERSLMDEFHVEIVRSSFDPYQLAWVKPDGVATTGTYGKKIRDVAFRYWQGLEVVLSLEISGRLTDAQNDTINGELIAYAYEKGVRKFICLNEPEEWSAGINDPAKRSSLAAKVKRLLVLIHKHAPEAVAYAPALHGWYAGPGERLSAAIETQREVARKTFLWANEPWIRTTGFAANIYAETGSMVAKVRAVQPALVSEINRMPGAPYLTGYELREVATLPVDAVIFYCVSGHKGYELMTSAGVRDEARITALKRGLFELGTRTLPSHREGLLLADKARPACRVAY